MSREDARQDWLMFMTGMMFDGGTGEHQRPLSNEEVKEISDRLTNYFNQPITPLGNVEEALDGYSNLIEILRMNSVWHLSAKQELDYNTIKKALQQRTVTSEEIVKELNEWDTQNEWSYDKLLFFVDADDNCFIEYDKEFGIDFNSTTVPLELAHKITTYFKGIK